MAQVAIRPAPRLLGATLGLAAAAVIAVVLAVFAPFPVAAFGVALLGPLHVLLATRYLTGRVTGSIPTSAVRLLVVGLAAMALARAFALVNPAAGQLAETTGGTVILSAALVWGLRGRWRLLALIPVLALGTGALLQTSWYWFALTHSHNLVPLVFLWDWTRGRPRSRRLAFTATCAALMLVFPATVMSGALDPLLSMRSAELVSGVVDPTTLIAGASHHGVASVLSLRLFISFVFLQLVHYALWMGFFQLRGRAETARSPLPKGRWFWLLAAGVTVVGLATYAISYADGRALYGVLGAINVSLEQPIAIWLLLTALPLAATTGFIHRLRR